MRIGINGFGRIGRNFTKALLEHHPDVEIAAVNDLTSAKECAHLFKYDSNYGTFPGSVTVKDDTIAIDGRSIKVLAERDPGQLPWKSLGVDVVVESTGFFTKRRESARAHRRGGGAKKVIISAPAKNEDITIVLGVNDQNYDPAKHHIISNGVVHDELLGAGRVKVVVDELGWVKAFMSTIHSYTNDQNILDAPHSDLRRARNAATNIIPTSTGAAKALFLTIPEVKGSFDGFGKLRVPTPTVSMVYLVAASPRRPRPKTNSTRCSARRRRTAQARLCSTPRKISSRPDFKRNPLQLPDRRRAS